MRESAIGRKLCRPLRGAQGLVEHVLVTRSRRRSQPDLIQVVHAEQGPGIGIIGLALGRPLQAALRRFDARRRHVTVVVEDLQNAFVGAQALRGLAPHELHFLCRDDPVRLPDLDGHATRDVALQPEQIRPTSDCLVGGRPQLSPGRGIDHTSGHADASLGLSDTALQDVTDAELAMKLLIIHRRTVAGAGLAPVDEQLLELCQVGKDLLGDASGEVGLRGITAEVLERQHDDRRAAARRIRDDGLRLGRRIPDQEAAREGDGHDAERHGCARRLEPGCAGTSGSRRFGQLSSALRDARRGLAALPPAVPAQRRRFSLAGASAERRGRSPISVRRCGSDRPAPRSGSSVRGFAGAGSPRFSRWDRPVDRTLGRARERWCRSCKP